MNTVDLLRSKKLVIAIDGHSSCGKSTIAKGIAEKLNYKFVDTGAMYRAITWFSIDRNIAIESIPQHLDNISLHFANVKGVNTIYLNDVDVSKEIRFPKVSSIVSEVATLSPVRKKLVSLQQSYGKDGGIVMDGRDIGTKVFPNADVKLFVTADINIRAKRRFQELKERDNELSLELVMENLAHRDHIDSTRADSPLTRLPEATLIDTSLLSRSEQLDYVLKKILEAIS